MSDFKFDAATQRGFDALAAQLESLPAFRERRAEANRITLMQAALPLNVIVLELPAACVRLYIRALRSAAQFRCDVLDRSVLLHEPVENVVALMRCHVFERTPVGIKLHVVTSSYPSAADLIDPNEDED